MKFHHTLLLALCAAFSCLAPGSLAEEAPDASQPEKPVAQLPAKEQFHIYLLMGQSNMAGRGRITPEAQTTNPRVLVMTPEGKWTLAKDPLHEQFGRIKPGIGPGMSFAAEMINDDPKVTIGLVPCAVGGTPLRRWEKSKRGDLYKRAIERAGLAAGAGTISGMIWHQGESDSSKMSFATSYGERLARMIGNLRQDLGRPDLPVVVGQLGEFLTAGDKRPGLELVRTALKDIPDKVPNTGYADSKGLKDKGDGVHFGTKAQREFGRRYAMAMKELKKAE